MKNLRKSKIQKIKKLLIKNGKNTNALIDIKKYMEKGTIIKFFIDEIFNDIRTPKRNEKRGAFKAPVFKNKKPTFLSKLVIKINTL